MSSNLLDADIIRRMLVNLNSSKGLIVGEAVMMGIAPIVGRNAAHDIVYSACKDCIEDGKSTLYDRLSISSDVTDRISKEELAKLCDPVNYLGAAPQMVDDVLASSTRRTSKVKANGISNGNVNGNGVNGVNGHH